MYLLTTLFTMHYLYSPWT